MDYKFKIKSNIWKYYLTVSLFNFSFYIPIIQLFYLASELTIFNIAMLGVIWTIVKMITEVPSSILADKWGRKKTMILSFIFSCLSILFLIYATNFGYFIVASIFSAAAAAFMSGTDIAFFYDSLKVLKKEKEFDKLWARQSIYTQIPLFIAFISSGILYTFSPLLPFKLSLFFILIALLITLTLHEPRYYKPVNEINVFSHFKESAQFIFKNSYLKVILIFMLFFVLASDFSYGYGQIYLNYLSLPVIFFGIVYTLKSLTCTFAENLASPLKKWFSESDLFSFQIISITLLFLVMVLTKNYYVGALCFILIAIPHGLFSISKSSYMHRYIPSQKRATIDSMFSFFIALMFLILEPIFGYLADTYTIKLPFLIITIVLACYCLYFILLGKNKFITINQI